MPGARCILRQYAPTATYPMSVIKDRRAKGFHSCSQAFGSEVDMWLQKAVEHGWLDWGATCCDSELTAALSRPGSPARAAQCLWQELVARGFIAVSCQEQVSCSEYATAPVLDLKGYNHHGENTVVEVKCGWAHSASKGTGQLAEPYSHINNNDRNLALLQLAMQVSCLRATGTDLKTSNAWMAALSPIAAQQQGLREFDVIIIQLKDLHMETAQHMLQQHVATSTGSDQAKQTESKEGSP